MSNQLILNPVENLPYLLTSNKHKRVHGLYVSDKIKNDEIIKSSIIGFSGRQKENDTVQNIYLDWRNALDCDYISMRLLSGLHAHTVLFMGLGNINDTVMILPIEAGGHFSTKKILERLGYHVIEAIPNYNNYSIDFDETLRLIKSNKPKLLFIDRSEGIYYEDFTALINSINYDCGTIFDASQYLTNILMKDFKSPFDMGFHLMMSTLHKNFPGPQKAMLCSKDNNIHWQHALYAINNYVSNIHVEQIYMAGDILNKRNLLNEYSKLMIENSVEIEKKLVEFGLPVILKDSAKVPTHHIWINFNNKEKAFEFYKKMEQCGFLVNYRNLPYNLGYGIRMGTSAASLQGINKKNRDVLATLISKINDSSFINENLIQECQNFINSLKPLPTLEPQY